MAEVLLGFMGQARILGKSIELLGQWRLIDIVFESNLAHRQMLIRRKIVLLMKEVTGFLETCVSVILSRATAHAQIVTCLFSDSEL